jgi:SAM-dependent methyltransferase
MTTTWVGALLRKQRETRENGVSPFPHQAAFLLDNPIRRTFVNPARTVESIGLTGSERVLELGPGPGFYSVEIARRLTGGRLDLFDLQPEMLDKARRHLERAGFGDVGFTAGQAGQDLPFPDLLAVAGSRVEAGRTAGLCRDVPRSRPIECPAIARPGRAGELRVRRSVGNPVARRRDLPQ